MLLRPFALIASVLLLVAPITPAFAGAAESAFLSKLAGRWTGSGKLVGEQTGPVACSMAFKASGAKVNYTGRCNIQDVGAQSFSGTIGYDDSAKRYIVRSGAGSSTGVKRGSALVFTTKTNTMNGSSYSTMTLSASRITIDFTIVSRKTGGKTTSHIVFSK